MAMSDDVDGYAVSDIDDGVDDSVNGAVGVAVG